MTREILRLWALLLLLKFIISAWLPMTTDEAYYWVWSRHLQLSYYDHPPMVAWLMYLGEPLLAFARAVRWPTVLMGHTTILIWLYILRDSVNQDQLKMFLLLGCLTPLIGPGSLIVTPDVPLIFFWSCGLYCLHRALQTRAAIWYALLGAALGLGFCSKYQIVLFIPVLGAWLFFEKEYRKVVWRHVPLTIVAGLVCCLPVLYWNWQNGFESFRFQMNHGLGRSDYRLTWTLTYVVGQVLLIFPSVLYVVLNRAAGSRNWLWYFAWGPLAFFFVTSFRSPVEANWPIAAYPSLIALAVIASVHVSGARRALNAAMGIWITLLIMLLSTFVWPWLPLSEVSARYEVMQEYYHLKKVAREYRPIYAGNYQIASLLSFESQTTINKARGYSRRDFFDEIPDSIPRERAFFAIIEKEQRFPQFLQDLGYTQVSRVRIDHHHFLIEARRN